MNIKEIIQRLRTAMDDARGEESHFQSWLTQNEGICDAIDALKELDKTEQEPCGGCGGSGWVTRDPDIGTDQECFVCGGSGAYPKEPEQEPCCYGGIAHDCHAGEGCRIVKRMKAAQPEHEPVIVGRWPSAAIGRETLQDAIERERAVGYREGHRAALAQRTWVGLTDEDWNRSKHNYDFQKGVDWAESILKKKNT